MCRLPIPLPGFGAWATLPAVDMQWFLFQSECISKDWSEQLKFIYWRKCSGGPTTVRDRPQHQNWSMTCRWLVQCLAQTEGSRQTHHDKDFRSTDQLQTDKKRNHCTLRRTRTKWPHKRRSNRNDIKRPRNLGQAKTSVKREVKWTLHLCSMGTSFAGKGLEGTTQIGNNQRPNKWWWHVMNGGKEKEISQTRTRRDLHRISDKQHALLDCSCNVLLYVVTSTILVPSSSARSY